MSKLIDFPIVTVEQVIRFRQKALEIEQQCDELLDAAYNVITEWDKWKGFAGISDEDVAFEAAVVKLANIMKAGNSYETSD